MRAWVVGLDKHLTQYMVRIPAETPSQCIRSACLISFELRGFYCVCVLGGRAPPETNVQQPSFYANYRVVDPYQSMEQQP